ncbi:mycofactocin biosynthesis peptidyl-dipeptidase MftE [Ilumatobacter sp.]|uniref:mycofactocin biosynthesis peptidyl-dipeptidase MftE n=1 Tax=Ilumatobacter sp. TaxID=1967498 RepID=UPI003C51C2BC
MRLGEATWNEVHAAKELMADDDGTLSPIVLIPVGSTEQHGPHLPLNTDTLVAEEIAGRALHRTTGLILGPTISITASGEHAGFAGTLSIGVEVMADVATELGRSADWAAGVVFVNGHGGNHEPLTRAAELLTSEGRHVFCWWPRWRRRTDGGPPDLHAGRIETSMMLAIDPGLVRLELGVRGPDLPLDELLPRLRSHGVHGVSPTGVLGDPDGASGAEGERFIEDFVDDLVLSIERWRPVDAAPPETPRSDAREPAATESHPSV